MYRPGPEYASYTTTRLPGDVEPTLARPSRDVALEQLVLVDGRSLLSFKEALIVRHDGKAVEGATESARNLGLSSRSPTMHENSQKNCIEHAESQ
jgi:hypothetical protein